MSVCRFLGRLLGVLLAGPLLAACADRQDAARSVGSGAGLQPRLLAAGGFHLASWSRLGQPGAPLMVYVEGDGFAWADRGRPSPDPTPKTPLALRLAVRDPSPNLLYLARPCQYAGRRRDALCADAAWWTSRRYGEEVIAATAAAVEQVRAAIGAPGVHLVGYSGGGAVAALVAATRQDVLSLRTVAGNLDHATLNAWHKVTPLTGSLNAADVAPRLAAVPQLHYVGGRDAVVVPAVTQAYAARVPGSPCLGIETVPEASHDDGWEAFWTTAVGRLPACR